ncbi:MAG: methylmalonyl Co-A mutase-associated GTPase MeaB [Actinomycetota bacterium]
MGAPIDLVELVAKLEARDRRTIARLISLVEDAAEELPEVIRAVSALHGGAYTVGITGPPGAGKSTLVSALVGVLRARNLTVSVLAIDPTSPFSGGALLGDRLRMQEHATDPGVFIRSMATRGQLGGLAWAAPHALRILDAIGTDVMIVETVGVGQAEVDVAREADTTVVVLAPGFGDAIQANKAGLLEIADIYVVNKADREGAGGAAREIKQMLHLGAAREWEPPVLLTQATESKGVEELWDAVEQHRAHIEASGELRRRRIARNAHEIVEIALGRIRRAIDEVGDQELLDSLAAQVTEHGLDPYTAADKLLAQVEP